MTDPRVQHSKRLCSPLNVLQHILLLKIESFAQNHGHCENTMQAELEKLDPQFVDDIVDFLCVL